MVFGEVVYFALSQLDPNKAIGIDTLSPKILKHCALSLTRWLYHFFNLSVIIPHEWKSSERSSSVKNYRSISLLCNTSTVLEPLIYNKLINHMLSNNTKCQFEFLPSRSTTQQLLLHISYQANSYGHQTDSIYLRNAYDSVPHNKLLIKIYYGIAGHLWNWFYNYLCNRTQRVKIGTSISDPLPVLSEVRTITYF